MERSDPSPSSEGEQNQPVNEPARRSGGPGSGTRKSVEFADQVEKKNFDNEEDEMASGQLLDSDCDQPDKIDDDNVKEFPSDESDSESEVDIRVKPDMETSSEASSAALDKPGYGHTHPRIARGFRPEITDDPANRESRTSKRSVSFTPKPLSEMEKSKSPAVKETTRRKGYDGREITMVTLDTQTDWDWAEVAIESGLGRQVFPREGDGDERSREKSDLKSILVKPDSRELTSQSKTDTTEASVDGMAPTTPYTPYSDEFGIPILDISTDDSDDSSDEGSHRNDDRNFLPSIGPPQILQYIRESELNDIEVEDPDARKLSPSTVSADHPVDEFGRPYGMFGGKCEFCQNEIKPFPSQDRQQKVPANELYCCEEYRDFVNFAATTAMELEEEAKNAQKLINIKPHAHFGTKKDRKMAKERAVQRMRDRELQRRQQEASGLQQNFYSLGASVGSGGGQGLGNAPTARPAQVATMKANIMPQGGGLSYKDMASSNRSSGLLPNEVARQMKTINYQLSSQRCLEEGWTLRPPSPLDDNDEDVEIFVPEPLNPAMMSLGNIRNRPLIQRYYEDGKKFLTIFPDGSGSVFYPSGQVAILISCVSLGQYIYVVHDNMPEHTVQAVFEPTGYGSCYHNNGVVRLFFDQLGGIELDVHGGRRRKWNWKDPETHVHAPPFQPICFGLNRHIGLRVMSQESIVLTLTAKKRSCRFNVGSRLKLVAPGNIPPKEIDDAVLFLDEHKAFVETILDKVSNLLKFPKSPKLDKILPPIHITSKIQRTERLRREKAASRLGTSPKTARKGILPVVTVN